ncbi:AAA family ATPase [Actinoallomurus sp. NPDC050550]|uniref:AAA family ATPase n=1 Tax=Actinoallomurus sp. NPDC050550 TaxID=3154937 RepID=UPI0033E84015
MGRLRRDLAVVDPRVADLAAAAFYAARGFTPSEEQAEVLERLVSAGHGVDAVVGVAGAGKTTLMAAARTAWQAAGYTVAGAATAAVAAQNLQAESGIGSGTIASWIQAITGPGRDDGTRGLDGVDVLVIDEAGMVDDRELALLLHHAQQADTKVVLIGDPKQLKAVGVGGSFAAIHRHLDGPTLTENRRQADPIERRALQLWRADRREQALHAWAAGGRVHAGADRDDTLAAMLADWAHLRTGRYPDAHAELADMLLLAGTNNDAEAINTTARALRGAAGELTGPDVTYRTPAGPLRFAVGDHVRVRRNDYRTRRKNPPAGAVDVLNGYRGVITAIDTDRNVLVEWRRQAADSPRTESAWITPPEIAAGALSHGTAMTVAAAQGLTADITLVYGQGLAPHTLYPAMSRDREQAHLYLPRNLLEDDADRARHGDPETEGQELARAIAAYARTLEGDRADRLALTELGREPAPVAERIPHWTKRPYGNHTRAQLANLCETLQQAIRQEAARERRIAARRAEASVGNGPAASRLRERLQTVEKVAGIERQITAARAELDEARDHLAAARQRVEELQHQSRRGRLALRLDGTSRHQIDQDMRAAEGELRDARTAPTGARHRLAELIGQARPAYEQDEPGSPAQAWTEGAGTAEHQDLTTRWDTRLAKAITGDIATVHLRATTAVDVALPDLTTADKGQETIAAIDEELTLRDRLTPAQARIEQRARRAQQRAQAERDAQRRGYNPQHLHQPGQGIRPNHGPGRRI